METHRPISGTNIPRGSIALAAITSLQRGDLAHALYLWRWGGGPFPYPAFEVDLRMMLLARTSGSSAIDFVNRLLAEPLHAKTRAGLGLVAEATALDGIRAVARIIAAEGEPE